MKAGTKFLIGAGVIVSAMTLLMAQGVKQFGQYSLKPSELAQRVERERVGLLRRRNRTTGRTALAVTLPNDIDTEHVTADLKHGVLTVVIPKAPLSRRRHIPISQRVTR